jgi:hypothetical protein
MFNYANVYFILSASKVNHTHICEGKIKIYVMYLPFFKSVLDKEEIVRVTPSQLKRQH